MGFLTDTNIISFNSKVAKLFLLYNPLKNVIIVQRNKSRYMINWLQVEQFIYHTGCKLYF